MIRTAILINLLCISLLIRAQVFNTSYDFANVGQTSWNIEQVGNDFMILCGSLDSNNSKLGLYNIRISSIGTIQSYSSFFDPSSQIAGGWANSTNPTSDGGYIMGGGIDNGVDYGYLVKFNAQGDTVWTKLHGSNSFFDSYSQARQTKDGGYIAIGRTNRLNGQAVDGWLVKTDSLGNIQWQKIYGDINLIERLSSVYETKDGGYILGGTQRDDRVAINRNYDPIIYKVDSAGGLEWSYWHDTPYDDAIAHVIQTSDGNYVFSSGVSTSKGSSAYSKGALFKLDTAGNLMWLKKYGPTGYNSGLLMVKELPDSSLIAAGRLGVLGPKIMGLLVHADKNGDSLFVETYENDPANTGNGGQNYLWDVIQLPDKGFMATGEVVALPPQVAFRQDVWTIRVDSNGCILQSCLMNLNEFNAKAQVEVYPNPSLGIINIESEESFNKIAIYDIQGRLLQIIKQPAKQIELPQAKGIYLLRLELENGEVLSRKVIKN